MDKPLKIKVSNGKYISGNLAGDDLKPLIIFVHGFKGNKDEAKYVNGASYFEKLGFSSFRFNLYDNEKDGPKLEDSTLSLEAEDLDLVVNYFKAESFRKIFVVGHSFGGLVILLSKKEDFSAVALWDTAVDTTLDKKQFDSLRGTDNAISEKMFEENNHLDPLTLIKNTHIPVKLIWAEESVLGDKDNQFYELANSPKEMITIKGASHDFAEVGVEEELFKETYSWFKEFV